MYLDSCWHISSYISRYSLTKLNITQYSILYKISSKEPSTNYSTMFNWSSPHTVLSFVSCCAHLLDSALGICFPCNSLGYLSFALSSVVLLYTFFEFSFIILLIMIFCSSPVLCWNNHSLFDKITCVFLLCWPWGSFP